MRRLSFAVLGATDDETVYTHVARELLGVLALDQVHVTRLAQDHSVGRGNPYRAGPDGTPVKGPEYVLQFDEQSAVARVMESGEPLNVPDAAHDPVINKRLQQTFNVASALFVPVAFEGEVRTVLVLASETARTFEEYHVQIAYTLANQASAALGVLEMRGRLHARAEQQTALARAASALNARLDLNSVLSTLCREANLALGGDLAGVYLGDAESGGLAVAGDGMPEDSDWYGYVIRPGEGVGGQVLVTGKPAVSNSYHTDVQVPESDVLRPIQTAASVPVSWDGELKGALSIGFLSMRRVTDEDIAGLKAIADLAGVASRNAEAFERAQVAARTDSLTGLLNHGAVHVLIREEIERARRSGEPLCCLLMDLDNFKPINDVHGHLVGDQVLQQAADALKAEFRTYDGIGRFGGDEFVLVLPGLDESGAQDAALRLQKRVARTLSQHAPEGGLTASVGIARWREPLTAPELLDRADRALLVAKARGKDQAILADAETEAELARLESANGTITSSVLADLWDMISGCRRPSDVLDRLAPFLREQLGLEDAVLVRDEDHPLSQDMLARLDGGGITRSGLRALREALGAPELPAPAGDGSYAALALARESHSFGLLILRSSAPTFPLPSLRVTEQVASQAVTALVGQTRGASRSAVAALAAAIDARDNYTHSHSEQVVTLACEVAVRLGLDDDEVDRVRVGAMLHDVGKVAIPNEILFKEGPLDPREWAIMREHPSIGERILLRTPDLAPIAPLVRHEHERWDGLGYPDGLRGEEIPVGSRIILACDAYNAMITARPYREPKSADEALAELERGSGGQFDPNVIDALIEVLAEHPVHA